MAALLASAPAIAGSLQWDSYAVKFVCGKTGLAAGGPTVEGTYRTVVNVHNPHYLLDGAGAPVPVQFLKKIVLAPSQSEPRLPPSCLLQELLDADTALSVRCSNIKAQLAISGLPSTGFLEGFVVVLVPPGQGVTSPVAPTIDVTAVYTAVPNSSSPPSQSLAGVRTVDVERVTAEAVRGTPTLDLCD